MLKRWGIFFLIVLICFLKNQAYSQDYFKIQKIILQTSKNFPGDAGIVFYDLKNLKLIHYQGKTLFSAASLIKIPILAAVFNQALQGKISLSQKLIINKEDRSSGGGILKYAPPGSKISLEKAAILMIKKSDNTACNLLLKLIGFKAVNDILRKIGLKETRLKRNIADWESLDKGIDNYTTPLEMLELLKKIYQGKILNSYYSKKILVILKSQELNELIPKKLPLSVKIAHKTGQQLGILHDAGIIYAPRAYILCLLGKNILDENKAKKNWQELSYLIYKEMEKINF
ncbi:MAG: serine hydrolase [Armatimonadetes bacterium]|nr:serine hydrolase [Armatimonadota bacterium]